jgi:hypothetical protein
MNVPEEVIDVEDVEDTKMPALKSGPTKHPPVSQMNIIQMENNVMGTTPAILTLPGITNCSSVAKLPTSPTKRTKIVVPCRSSPRGNHNNPNIIGPISSPPGQSTRSAAHDFFKKRPRAKPKAKVPNKRGKKVTSMTDTETQAALAASIANTRTIAAIGQEKIQKEKDMVVLTKRHSNHHGFSPIWHLDIARDSDVLPETKALFADPGKFYNFKI